MQKKTIGITLKIIAAVIVSASVFWFTGEWVLKNLTNYGIVYFMEFGENVILKNGNLPHMPSKLVNEIENLKKGNVKENMVMYPRGEYKILILGDSLAISWTCKIEKDSFPE